MSTLKRLMVIALVMALFCSWMAFVYIDGRDYDWIFAVGYSCFVVSTLAAFVFAEEISRLMK